MTEKPSYRNISMKTELADAIEDYIKAHLELGYRSLAQFLEDSSRRRLEELRSQEQEVPRMEKINCDNEGCKIHDRKLGRVADITFKPSGIRCSLDETSNCEHIKFALEHRDVKEIIMKKRKQGWKLSDV